MHHGLQAKSIPDMDTWKRTTYAFSLQNPKEQHSSQTMASGSQF